MQHPQEIVYRVPHPVKEGETINWSPEADWFDQFVQHLDTYINNPRRKSRTHREFSQALKQLTNNIAQAQNKQMLIKTDLIPFIQERKKLSERGWNREKSYLYSLCVFSVQQYSTYTILEAARTRLKQSVEREVSQLREQNTTLSREVSRLKKTNEELERTFKSREETSRKDLLDAIQINSSQQEDILKLTNRVNELAKKLESQISSNDDLNLTLQQKEGQLKSLQGTAVQTQQTIERLQLTLSQTEEKLEEKANETPYDEREITYKKRISELEQANLRLQQEKEELESYKELSRTSMSRGLNLITENTDLKDRVTRAEFEVAGMRKAYDMMASFIDRVFGTTFGSKPSEYITKHLMEPTVSQTQARLIQTIYLARPEGITKELEEEITSSAEQIKLGQDISTLEDKMKTKVTKGITFLGNLPNSMSASKLVVSASELSLKSLNPFSKGGST